MNSVNLTRHTRLNPTYFWNAKFPDGKLSTTWRVIKHSTYAKMSALLIQMNTTWKGAFWIFKICLKYIPVHLFAEFKKTARSQVDWSIEVGLWYVNNTRQKKSLEVVIIWQGEIWLSPCMLFVCQMYFCKPSNCSCLSDLAYHSLIPSKSF